jgi:hypothetical protein
MLSDMIEGYLVSTNHYLQGSKLVGYYRRINNGEEIHTFQIANECLATGYEVIELSNGEVFAFLYSKIMEAQCQNNQ